MQRLVAQLIIAGGSIFIRAAAQAYQQALKNSQTSGVAAETIQNAVKGKQLSLEEAFKILGLTSEAKAAEIMKKYKHLFEVNSKNGSFYLQSKVYRAWERLDQEYGLETKNSDNDNNQQQGRLQQSSTETQEQDEKK
eukprot:TRINITY_DN28895_c0_g1_i1.p5 TRINITY_DN28895_c0_g1~~TRINITY_DN28895_c0_g1_i1.p5  ORF type:complete len:137 (+),score=23.71 TRINITY_DN28895_c0_g1_i1:112-522(+)